MSHSSGTSVQIAEVLPSRSTDARERGVMESCVFLYANQPVLRRGDHYYAKFKNFVDFLSELAGSNGRYRLMIPCSNVSIADEQEKVLVALDLPKDVVELSYYRGGHHFEAITRSFVNALRVYFLVVKKVRSGTPTVVGGPGPNSFLFWLSLIVPKRVRFVFFIRGDTVETVRQIYRGSVLYFPAMFLVKLFRWRLCWLLKNGRAKVFVFGEKLRQYYAEYREDGVQAIAPLLPESFLRRDYRPPISHTAPLKVLFVGRLSKEKNVLALLEACRTARELGRPFQLTVIGFGPLDRVINEFIRQFGLAESVNCLGYIPSGGALFDQYDGHDLFCLPSFTEGTPRVVVEAFARSMPVVATKVGSLPHLFPEEIKFIEGFQPADIARAIEWCSNHREEISLNGRQGFTKVEPFLISRNAQMVNRIIKEELSAMEGA